MKTKIIIAITILIIGTFFAFSFAKKSEVKNGEIVSEKLIHTDFNSFADQSVKSLTKNNINYFVKGANKKTITKSKLIKAKTLKDIIEHFPTSWISEYVSIDVYRTTAGKEVKASSKNLILTAKQKALFKNANIGDDVLIKIAYKSKNSVTNKLNLNEANIKMKVFPESSARFIGNENSLQEFLVKNSDNDLANWQYKPMESAIASFVINEIGTVTAVKIVTSTGVVSLDQSIIALLYKMPNWKPAMNYNGKPVKQQFEFVIGDMGC
ncbi:energy transducer TonB [Tenacibaculum insulae]|uniref:energy transducer TonB n=1 Tax=Tenacibaculum insulae TaxID=2029677 RepID=UPI003AB82B23